MTEAKTRDVPTFQVGDAIRIELRVSDRSGVSRVETRFRVENNELVKSIYRSVALEGETEALAVIELQADENLPPGDYVCEYVAITDQKGNQSVIAAPGIEFRIEGDAEDHQGPMLLDWSVA